MIAEVGVKQPSAESPQVLKEFMDGARQIKDCAGVFYWEPESSGWNGGYDMGAFKDGKPWMLSQNKISHNPCPYIKIPGWNT